jgi:protein TonB
MFEDALLESARHTPGKQRTLSTATSLALQCGLMAGFILAPLLAKQVVPDLPQHFTILTPHLETEAPPIEQSGGGPDAGFAVESTTALLPPSQIRPLTQQLPEQSNPQSITSASHSSGPGPLASLFSSGPVIPESGTAKHPIISVLEQGVVLNRVQPIYPPLAIQNRIQGAVHVHAVISASGTLESLHVIDGHPMLVRSALEAVRQWRFRPYVLNGNPIEVQTEITVNFSLN